MKNAILISIILLIIVSPVSAQECGPSCPVCSGSTDGSLLAPRSIFLSALSIPDGEEEIGVINLRFGILSRFDAGVGYGYKSEKALWSARFQVLTEEESWRPGVILGSGSVRTGKSDQSLYLHLTKSWEFSEALALRVTTGVASLVPEYDKLYGLGSISTSIAEKYSPFVSYDGINFHEGFAWIPL
ncbi:hypothetical protein ACFL47_08050, partial [Candidatus Latescibacterota bacterium]